MKTIDVNLSEKELIILTDFIQEKIKAYEERPGNLDYTLDELLDLESVIVFSYGYLVEGK